MPPRLPPKLAERSRRMFLGLRGLNTPSSKNLPAVIPDEPPLERMINKPRKRRSFLKSAARAVGSRILPNLPLSNLAKWLPTPSPTRQPSHILFEGMFPVLMKTAGELQHMVTGKESKTIEKDFYKWMDKEKEFSIGNIDASLEKLTEREIDLLLRGEEFDGDIDEWRRVGNSITTKISEKDHDEIKNFLDDYSEYHANKRDWYSTSIEPMDFGFAYEGKLARTPEIEDKLFDSGILPDPRHPKAPTHRSRK